MVSFWNYFGNELFPSEAEQNRREEEAIRLAETCFYLGINRGKEVFGQKRPGLFVCWRGRIEKGCCGGRAAGLPERSGISRFWCVYG